MGLVYQRIADKQGVIYINKQKIGMIIGGIALVGVLGFTTIQVAFAEPVYPDWMKEPVEDLSQETMNSQFAFAADGYEDLETWQNDLAAQIQEQKNMINDMRVSEYLYDEDAAQLNQLESDISNCLSIATLGEYQIKLDEMLSKLEERKAAAIEQARLEAEAAEKKKVAEQQVQQQQFSSQPSYSSGNIDLRSAGVVNWGGYRFTWYSQRVLPGGGLNIPGRHVNGAGFVCDGDGYIVAASAMGRGTIGDSPWGAWKSYDTGVSGSTVDIYTDW